ncbi:MAG: dynamin family protein [Pseudonocardiaceae bacterium]
MPPVLANIARRLDPEYSSWNLELLRDYEQSLGGSYRNQICTRLRQISAAVVDPEVKIVFGGHLSSGKSSLVNSIIGQRLLPTDDSSCTGVPCVIRAGRTDRVCAITGQDSTDPVLATGVIPREVPPIGSDGAYPSHLHEIDHVVITLAGTQLSPRALWIDSPGIADSDTRTARAATVAAGADVLVWVVDSRHPLVATEQDYLHDHVAAQGPTSVVFVVNAFLSDDTPESWTAFRNQVAGCCRRRITEFAGNVDIQNPEVVIVSARASTADPTRFGGPELRALLARLQRIEMPWPRATRLHRAATALRELSAEVEEVITRERAVQTQDRQRRSHAQRQRFERQMPQEIAAVFDAYRAPVSRCTTNIVASMIDPQVGDHDDEKLTAALLEVAEQLARSVIGAVDQCAARFGQAGLGSEAVVALRALLQPTPVVMQVTDLFRIPVDRQTATEAIGGVVIDGVIGFIPDPSRRVSTTRGLRSAGDAAAAALLAKQEAVTQLVLQACAPVHTDTAHVDDAKLYSLTTLRQLLHSTVELATRGARHARREISP